MTGVIHLVAARGDNGELLRSTWETGQPQMVVLAPDQLLEGLVEGLAGMEVGGQAGHHNPGRVPGRRSGDGPRAAGEH